jgi:glycosyltransferase involved in cell wall biosynthesis
LGLIRLNLGGSLRRLDRVIAPSVWVKEELCEIARVKESRIDIIPNAVDTNEFHPRKGEDEKVLLIQPYSFQRPYILYSSRLVHPVKNHVNLIKAFTIFKEREKLPHRLVLSGASGKGADLIKNLAATSRFRNDIFVTGPFPAKNLPELVAGAEMVVIPSMYEGFGTSALEAMASGVPVACARAAALPEIADTAALYFDPASPEDMADRLTTLALSKVTRARCIERGLARAAEFSWDKTAEQTLKVILETAG